MSLYNINQADAKQTVHRIVIRCPASRPERHQRRVKNQVPERDQSSYGASQRPPRSGRIPGSLQSFQHPYNDIAK